MRFWWNPWGEWAIQGADGRRSTEDEAESLLASLHPIAGSLPACTASHWPQRPRSLRPATPLYAQSLANTKRREEGRVALKQVNRQGGQLVVEWWRGNGEKFWEWKGTPQCSIHPLHVSDVHVKCRTNAYLHLFSAKESITLQFLPKLWDCQICTSVGCNRTKGLMLRKLSCS